jgi:hypothetical protein
MMRNKHFYLALLAASSPMAISSNAAAADGPPADQDLPRLGMSPGEPQVRSAMPALPFGVNPATSREFVLDFHGYLLLPANVGFHERPDPLPGQSSTVLHTPPLMAQDLRDFQYTGAVPSPWLQLNFSYGNATVAATTILSGRTAMDAAGYFNPVDQMGVSDAYITVNLTRHVGIPFQINVGAYTGRYGAMGTYDAGRYGTPLIARTNTIGENVIIGKTVGSFFLVLEQGLGGQLGRPPAGIVPAGWNDFADANVGATFVNQAHFGASYQGLARLGFHYVYAWTQDDLVNGGQVPDGSITVLGTDLNITAGRAGHLYLGATRTQAHDAARVSGAIEILNARGGPELMEHYLGPQSGGNGSLTTVGGQYDLSVSRAVFGKSYTGMSPDVLLSLFGIATHVQSDDPAFNNVLKVKGGLEVSYLISSWFGLSQRFDHVRLQGATDARDAISIWTSRLLFHTGWRSRDEFALQYSYFSYGSGVHPKTGYPPMVDPTVNPDVNVLSLSATFWW